MRQEARTLRTQRAIRGVGWPNGRRIPGRAGLDMMNMPDASLAIWRIETVVRMAVRWRGSTGQARAFYGRSFSAVYAAWRAAPIGCRSSGRRAGVAHR